MFTDHAGGFVEGEALVAGDGEAFVVVFPWSEQEELAAGAGVHALPTGLGEVCEAVFLKDDEWQAFVECGAHDAFLSR